MTDRPRPKNCLFEVGTKGWKVMEHHGISWKIMGNAGKGWKRMEKDDNPLESRLQNPHACQHMYASEVLIDVPPFFPLINTLSIEQLRKWGCEAQGSSMAEEDPAGMPQEWGVLVPAWTTVQQKPFSKRKNPSKSANPEFSQGNDLLSWWIFHILARGPSWLQICWSPRRMDYCNEAADLSHPWHPRPTKP